MVSFGHLWSIMEQEGGTDPQSDEDGQSLDPHGALLDSGAESQAMEAIRSGMHLRKKEECGDFWDDFITVCGNADALSELLNVPRETITGWPGKIRELKEKVDISDQEGDAKEKKAETLPTGETPTADFGHDGTVSMGNDTKPFPS